MSLRKTSINGDDCDVLIVGAGPTGLALCAELARQGIHSIRIIDKAVQQPRIAKGSGLWGRTLELLSAYNGVLDNLNSRAISVSEIHLKDQYTTLAKVDLKEASEKTGVFFNTIMLCEQWHTENSIYSYVKSKGKQIERGVELIDFKEDDDFVEVTVQRVETKEVQNFRAKFVIGCDGARSFVRKKLNIPFEGETLHNGFIACHFKAKAGTIDHVSTNAMSLYFFPDGVSFITPMPEGNWLVGADLSPENEKPFLIDGSLDAHNKPTQREPTRKELETLLSNRGFPGISIEESIWLCHYRVNERLSHRYTNGSKIFLAGDACHSHSPLGGQGMNTGIQDAINLGWKLATVVNRSCASSILSSYEPERTSVGKNVIDLAMRINKASTFYDPVLTSLRSLAVSFAGTQQFVTESIVGTLGETAYSYGIKGPISVEHWEKPPILFKLLRRRAQNILRLRTTRVHAGDRFPEFPMKDRSRFHEFLTKTPGFKLLVFQGDSKPEVSLPLSPEECDFFCKSLYSKAKGLITGYRILNKNDFANPDDAYSRIGIQSQCLFIVRPDGYVGFRCEPLREDYVTYYFASKVFASHVIAEPRISTDQGDWFMTFLLIAAAAGVGYSVYRQLNTRPRFSANLKM